MDKEKAGVGTGTVVMFVAGLLWINGYLDKFLVTNGLEDFVRGACIQTFVNWICGDDDIRQWCLTVALDIPINRELCAPFF